MNDLEFKDVSIFKDYIEIRENVRLYYERIIYDNPEDKAGFEFIAVECNGWTCDGKNEYNFSPKSTVEILISGIAYFDGIRHLYVGDEKSGNYGYLYYTNLVILKELFTELRKLEEKFCDEIET